MFDIGSDNNCSYVSSVTAKLFLVLMRVSEPYSVELEYNLKNSAIQVVEATWKRRIDHERQNQMDSTLIHWNCL